MITEIKVLKKNLPHGAVKEIAKRTGISTATISQVLNERVHSPKFSIIMKTTAEYMTEYKAKEKEAKQAIIDALQ